MTIGPLASQGVLSGMILLPAATALALLASSALISVFTRWPGLPAGVWRVGAIVGSSLAFLLFCVGVLPRFDPEQSSYQMIEYVRWLPGLGVDYFVAIDGIGLCLVGLASFVTPIALLASKPAVDSSPRSFLLFVLWLESAGLGALLALNLGLFYLFFEALLLPLYFAIGIWGGPRRLLASARFLVLALCSSAALLLAVLVLLHLNFEQSGTFGLNLILPPGGEGLALLGTVIPTAADGAPWWSTQLWLFVAFALAFSVRLPLFPLHGLFIEALFAAPNAFSVLMASLLIESGVAGFLRFALPLFPVAAVRLAPLFLVLGLAGVIHGWLVASAQPDLKKLAAYAVMAQMGFAVVGLFALDDHGLCGGVLQLLAQALASAALLLLVEVLHTRRGTRAIRSFGGLAKPMPVYGALLGVVALACIGLPGSTGFAGVLLLLLGSFKADPRVALGGCAGLALGAACMLRMYGRVALGPVEKAENRGLIDLGWRERVLVLALLVPLLGIGLYPNPVLRRIEPGVLELLQRMDERRLEPALPVPAPEPPAAVPSAGVI